MKYLYLLSSFALCLYGGEVLSPTQLDMLQLSKQKVTKDSKKLKIDWINPITYSYNYKDDDTFGVSKISTISISQPIFKSGGIYSAIKYANNLKLSSDISIELQKKELIKQALNIVLNIHKLNLQIEKQKLMLNNANIDLQTKKEAVFNGLLDMSFLNNSLITKNQIKAALLDLEYQKKILINNLANLSDKTYNQIEVPKLQQLTQEKFTTNNLYIKKNKLDIKTVKNQKWMTTARYLPTVNLNYNYTKNHTLDNTNSFYGFNIVIPFNFKGYYDTQASKISYLKEQKQLTITKLQQINFFKNANLKLKMLDKKIALTKENIIAYNELVEQTKELVQIGVKTPKDLKILQNSTKSEKLNIKIFDIDKQIELLEIYSKIYIKNKD